MTEGASQGLFVIVAIVIFGIFVLISYVLFKDTLKPSLANIFTDGLEQAEDAVDPKVITKITIVEKTNEIKNLKKNQTEEYYISEFTNSFEFRNQDGDIIKSRKLNLEFKFHDRSTTYPNFQEFMNSYIDGHSNLRMGVTATSKADKTVTATTKVNGISGITIFGSL
ncbi:TPA: hypothetical protein IUX45_002841 [Enterococcus faecalis]|uniref:Uncharacterized protein n=3 Tax=Bacilli TaxID=91061 RepID=A0A640MG71_BACAN|nr:hypothetical protein [Enterococcus faecalis]GEU13044.1 hypothetical protein QuyetLC_54730 [Bacillus anthracis]EGO7767524.1 hypothetical protein [Enterococcus faecalis]EIQ7141155.1 hypothetical protein [Enterococcus faecalis]EKE4879792.1 hypothetical protein [Enterococcus faecalis]MDN3143310.1 hypothetical protein [Enterococcus faecalis]